LPNWGGGDPEILGSTVMKPTRSRIVFFLILTLLSAGCRSATSPSSEIVAKNDKASLPQFEALDSEGNQIRSNQMNERVVIAAFFDPDSVLAWRTLSELDQKCQSQKNSGPFLIGVASSRVESNGMPNINSLKKQYQITFPIIPDQEKRLSQAFQSPNCCDYLNLYDKQGALKTGMRLSESHNKMDSIVAESLGAESTVEQPSQLRGPELLSRLKINRQGGVPESIPTSQGLTVVNVFDEFCTECPTGSRFQTISRLYRLLQPTTRIFMIFSEKNFSTEDVENFKTILSTPDSLVQGDVEALKPYMIKGKLLIVFDSDKNLIWQEKPEMTEQEVLAEVSGLLQRSTK
jgi:peroxiredoxin